MGYLQVFVCYGLVAKEHYVKIQGAWAPALAQTRAAMLLLDGLQLLKQLQRLKPGFQQGDSIGVAWLVGWPQRSA